MGSSLEKTRCIVQYFVGIAIIIVCSKFLIDDVRNIITSIKPNKRIKIKFDTF